MLKPCLSMIPLRLVAAQMTLMALTSLTTLTASMPAAAADKATLTSELQVWNVVKKADGAEALLPAQSVKPGDVLQYTAVYRNADSRAVNRLVASLPIPAGTELVAASTLPRDVLASLDGKVFAAAPLMRKQRRADGQQVDVPVPLTEYRYLRWPEQQVAGGGSFSTSARVRVVSALPAAAAAVTPATAPATAPTTR